MDLLANDVERHGPLIGTVKQETDIPAHRQKVELCCIKSDGKTFITCETDLYFCPSSPRFAHGPVIMRYVSTAAEKILEQGERIGVVSKVLFKKIIRKNLKIIIHDSECENYRTPNDSAVTGAFITTKERKLTFYCLEISSKEVTRMATINTLATDLLLPIRFSITDREVYRFRLNSFKPKKKSDSNINDVPMAIYILTEIAMLLIINYQNAFSSQKQHYLLLGKLENLIIPESLSEVLRDGTEVEFQLLKKRTPPTANALTVFQYRLTFSLSTSMSDSLRIIVFGTKSRSIMNKVLGVREVDIYTPLHNPDELTLETARDTYDFLKTTMVPYIQEQIKELYSRKSEDRAAFVRIFELELRLAEVRKYQNELLDIFGREAFFMVPANLKSVDLQDIKTDRNCFIHCIANLFFCPESKDFVHGPVMIRYIFTTAEKILRDKEKIVELENIYFRKLTKTNIAIHIQENPICDSEIRSQCTVKGVLVTSEQRKLYFWGVEIASSIITDEASHNEVVLNLIKENQVNYNENSSEYTITFNASNLSHYLDRLNESVPFTAYILLDLLSQSIVQLCSLRMDLNLLFCGLKHFVIPNDFRNELTLQIKFAKARNLSSGFCLRPGKFRYMPYHSNYAIGQFAESMAHKKITEYLHS